MTIFDVFLYGALPRVKPLTTPLLLVWLVVTIPIVAIFTASSRVREKAVSVVAERIHPEVVFVGDSHTALGGDWGSRLDYFPWQTWNLGRGSFNARQMRPYFSKAVAARPEWISLCAGGNDVTDRHYSQEETVSDIQAMIDEAHGKGIRVALTLVPYRVESMPTIRHLNDALRKIDADVVIDINPVIAPGGIVLPGYTLDGVHINESGYDLWAEALRPTLGDD